MSWICRVFPCNCWRRHLRNERRQRERIPGRAVAQQRYDCQKNHGSCPCSFTRSESPIRFAKGKFPTHEWTTEVVLIELIYLSSNGRQSHNCSIETEEKPFQIVVRCWRSDLIGVPDREKHLHTYAKANLHVDSNSHVHGLMHQLFNVAVNEVI